MFQFFIEHNVVTARSSNLCLRVWLFIAMPGYCHGMILSVCLSSVFSVLVTPSARGITSMIQKRLDKLRKMILDGVTRKQGKLIADED